MSARAPRPSGKMSGWKVICGYCHRGVHRQQNGQWYHNHNASVSCNPGSGNDRKAFPQRVAA